jgi:hypothetical protein
MNKNTIFLAIGIAAALAVVLAPSLVMSDASAQKTKTCTNGGGQTKNCDSPSVKREVCRNPQGFVVSCGEGFTG